MNIVIISSVVANFYYMSLYQCQKKIKIRWSSNFAYAIGLITSDGYLSLDKRHIGLKSIDLELIKNFKKAFSLKNRIAVDKWKHFHITFGDVIFYKFLNGIGLTSAKSKIIKEIAVPQKYFSDFLRGLFDGDGTFYTFWDKRWPNSFGYQIAFSSASSSFINWLKMKLADLYSVKGFIRQGDGVFNLRYVKGDTVRLFSAMYENKKCLLFLTRKYVKIKDALKQDGILPK